MRSSGSHFLYSVKTIYLLKYMLKSKIGNVCYVRKKIINIPSHMAEVHPLGYEGFCIPGSMLRWQTN